MIQIIIIFSELMALFLITSRLHKRMYTLFNSLFRSKEISIGLLTILYLPGTVIHELAHLIVAEVLRVPTGEISFTPQVAEVKKSQQEVRLGSLAIGNTDPFRRLLVGIAPLIFGLFFLSLLIWLYQYLWPGMQNLWQRTLLLSTTYFLLFSIGSNMFSSPKDMEGAIFVIPTLLLLIVALHFAGVRIAFTGQILVVFLQILDGLAKTLGIVLVINLILLFLNSLFLRFFIF